MARGDAIRASANGVVAEQEDLAHKPSLVLSDHPNEHTYLHARIA
jgi:hypothetical protein